MITPDDYRKQANVYLKNGRLWRVIGYCDEPSVTMEDVSTGARETFGVSGYSNAMFTPVAGLRYDHDSGIIKPNATT